MSRSLQEYHEIWKPTEHEWKLSEILDDADITNDACVIFESGGSSPMDEGMLIFPDFGDTICYYRYYRLPADLDPSEPEERRRLTFTNDELQSRLNAARPALDSLLEQFIQQGYQAEMSKRLQEIVNNSSLRLHLFDVYVLPGELDALLTYVGNPLADYDAYDTDEEAEANAPVFDLNNPEHRAALKENIWMVGR